jgi:pyrroline-5-carboxylate reductase
MSERIAFIGAGNMATALAGGLLRAGTAAGDLVAADPIDAQRERIARLGVTVTDDNAAAVAGAAVIVLAVKPQVLGEVVVGLRAHLAPNQLLLSIAAGVSTSAIAGWCERPLAIVRCMPNTPALHGAGIAALFANERVGARERTLAEAVLRAAGDVVWVDDEGMLDAVTAVSGSGPAYFFYLMESMIDAAKSLGLDDALARRLTLATAYGAAVMARDSADSPAQLRRNVTSPGGTTERAVGVFDGADVRATVVRAIRSAADRSRELAAEFGAHRGTRT